MTGSEALENYTTFHWEHKEDGKMLEKVTYTFQEYFDPHKRHEGMAYFLYKKPTAR